jgi:hypothetical protein
MNPGNEDGPLSEANSTPQPDLAASEGSAEQEALLRSKSVSAPNLKWPTTPPVIDVLDLDWEPLEQALDCSELLRRMPSIATDFQHLLELNGGMLFDTHRSDSQDRAILVPSLKTEFALWFIGDLHGDLLALEAALNLIRRHPIHGSPEARIVFLGDLFDDQGYGLEVLLRVFELAAATPQLICIIAGNHDEALGNDGVKFTSIVEPSDFSSFLNDNLTNDAIVRVGKLAIRLFASAPRALFLPDGLLVAHGGFPLSDLHAALWETGNWNDPRCLADFVWTRAHPTARKKMPNRFSKGSQFGHEDFATFCSFASSLGRTVTHMVRGHDHVENRFATYPCYEPNPILTTNALSRRLPRENTGNFERFPTVALYKPNALPQVFRILIPPEIVRKFYSHREQTIAPEAGS